LHALIWIIFALVYLGMALGRWPMVSLDRTGIALLGAIAMISVGGISLADAARSINYQTILLLFGLMLFSAQLHAAGFYSTVGDFLTHLTARPKYLLAGLVVASAFLSALLANDIICLAFTPMLCAALLSAKRNPIPYLVALAASSNIGSAATIIGNPQNMYIGVVGQLPFAQFSLVMLPITLLALCLCWATIVLVWHKHFFQGIDQNLATPTLWQEEPIPLDRPMVFKTLAILIVLVTAFLVLPAGPRVVAAIAGGGLLLISPKKPSAQLYLRIDWNLLLLFLGLFVVNGTMQQSGLMNQVMSAVRLSGVDLHRPTALVTTTAVLSNLVSNVPAVLLLQSSIAHGDRTGWYLLAMASTWAGNLTLVGSIANLIVAEQASRFGVKLDLKDYCQAGIPLTLINLAMGTAWIVWLANHH
jgi:Na+/H+ antiporter NhaD/arsenite permease-like protein